MMDLPIKILAVLGGATVGAFGTAAFVQVVARLTTGQRLPPWVVLTLRALGGIALGWLVALWVFGGGGGGVGGAGGLGLGAGTGKGDGSTGAPPRTTNKPDDEGPANPSETLRIEILGDEPLARISGSGRTDLERRYRIREGGTGARLLSLPEVKELLRTRREASPKLRTVQVVIYADSPAGKSALVTDFKDWASGLTVAGEGGKMRIVTEILADQKAPLK
jgi:hypothetical protein